MVNAYPSPLNVVRWMWPSGSVRSVWVALPELRVQSNSNTPLSACVCCEICPLLSYTFVR
jgi:hypothetical protein